MTRDLEILKKLIEIDSNYQRSNRKVIFYIKKLLSQFPCRIYSFRKGVLPLYNLVVKIKGDVSKNPLIFIGHTDTVMPSDNWTTDPLRPIVKEGKIYGLGASDMKVGLAAMIESALLIKKEKLPKDVYLIFDADEEGDSLGGRGITKELNFKAASIIIPESTAGAIRLGHKGCLELKIILLGKSYHASQTSYKKNLKNNAIYIANQVVNKLLLYEKHLAHREDQQYGVSTNTITFIQGIGGANVTPDKCIIKMSRRLLPKEDISQEYIQLKKLIRSIDPKAKIEPIFWGKTFEISKDNALVKKIASLTKEYLGFIRYHYSSTWTEAALFTKWGDCVIFGPGILEQAHKPNEYADLDIFRKFVRIYTRLMKEAV